MTGIVGACVGAVALHWLPPSVRVGVLGLVAVVVLGAEVCGRGLRLPQNARAVPVTVIHQGPVAGPLQFGFEMGTGLRTYMTSGAPHVLLVALVLLSGPLGGVVAGLGFGLGRAMMTAARGAADTPREWDRTFSRQRRPVGLMCAAAVMLLVVSVALGVPTGGA